MGKKGMKSPDPNTGRIDCKICGARKITAIKPLSGGKYSHDSLQCPHRCKTLGKNVYYNGFLRKYVNEKREILSREEVVKVLGEEKALENKKER